MARLILIGFISMIVIAPACAPAKAQQGSPQVVKDSMTTEQPTESGEGQQAQMPTALDDRLVAVATLFSNLCVTEGESDVQCVSDALVCYAKLDIELRAPFQELLKCARESKLNEQE